MAATNGTMSFMGLATRQTYTKDIYLSDTAGGLINWDAGTGAAAATPTSWRVPEPMVLRDLAVVTGAAQTKIQITRNGVPTGDMLRQTLHLNTLANRPVLNVAFNRGDEIAGIQLA
jgi:hypothetical protein